MGPTPRDWQELSDRLRAFARRRVRTPDAAEDVAQEAVARAVRAFGAAPADFPQVFRWSLRVARNLVVDLGRRRRAGTLDFDPAADPAADGSTGIEAELGTCARRLVDRLPPAYRSAVTLADVDGLPRQAVADRLGVSVSGAKSRVQRGRAMVRGMLLDCCRIEFGRRGEVSSCRRTARAARYC